MARQVGSALGVAVLVAIIGTHPIRTSASFGHAWILVLASAVTTGLAGLASAAPKPSDPTEKPMYAERSVVSPAQHS
jgi:hypothetical protein